MVGADIYLLVSLGNKIVLLPLREIRREETPKLLEQNQVTGKN